MRHAARIASVLLVVVAASVGALAADRAEAQVAGPDAPLTAQPVTLTASRGTPVATTVATFADADPAGFAGQFSATITWGDGSAPDAGATVIAANASAVGSTATGFRVFGTHTYDAPGTFTAHVAIQDVGGAATATDSTVTVLDSPAPVAKFGVPASYVLAGANVGFDGSASTVDPGAGPISYHWTFCPGAARQNPCPAGSPGLDGAKVGHAFSFAKVHDAARFPGGVKSQRRRSSYVVELTVGDRFGRTDTAVRLVTVVPDTPPKAAFAIGPAPVVAANAATITPQAIDPDTGDAIVEEDWDLTGDGKVDRICIAFKGCASAQAQAATAKPRLTVVPVGAGGDNEIAFPAFTYNFLDAELARRRLARLSAVDLGSLSNPFTQAGLATGQARFLRDFSYEINRLTAAAGEEFPYASDLPHQVTMWARDAEGVLGVAKQPLAFEPDQYPRSTFSFTPAPSQTTTLTTDDDMQFDLSGVGDPDGSVAWYELDVGQATGQKPYACIKEPPSTPGAFGLGQLGDPLPDPGSEPPLPQPPVSLAGLLAGESVQHHCPGFTIGYVKQAPNLATIVTKNPADLHFKFPAAGTYSVMLTAYDDIGLATRRRIDGFKVIQTGGSECAPTAGVRPIGPAGAHLGLSGGCVNEGKPSDFFYSRDVLDLNGLRLAPATGAAIVVDSRSGQPFRIYASKAAPPNFADAGAVASWANAHWHDTAAVDVQLDRQSIAGWEQFGVGTGQLLVNGNALSPAVSAGALYRSLPIASNSVSVQLGSNSNSTVKLSPQLPAIFGAGNAAGEVTFEDSNAPEIRTLTNHDAIGARLRVARAHAAASAGNVLNPPNGTALAGIPLFGHGGPLQFTYDAAGDQWSGDADITIPGLEAAGTVKIHLIFRGQSLISGTGKFSPPPEGVPVGPGVFVTELSFATSQSPAFTFTASVDITAAHLVTGKGTLTVTPGGNGTPSSVVFHGNLSLAGVLPLGGGVVTVAGQSATFSGNTGANFGPASFNATVSGGIAGDAFYAQGAGEACLFVCLDVSAIASSVGVAACGDIDLLLTSVSAGFGKPWNGLPRIYFSSCDTNDYKPAVFAKAQPTAPLVPSQSKTLQVPAGQRFVAIAVHAADGTGVAPHVHLTGPKGDARVAASPTEAGDYSFGLKNNAVATAAASGSVKTAQPGTTVVDENPLNATTTILVAKPAGGAWTLKVDPDSVDVTSVQLAKPLPPIPAHVAIASVGALPAAAKQPASKVAGAPLAQIARARPTQVAGAPPARIARVHRRPILPALERRRLRRLRFSVPKGMGKVTFMEQSKGGDVVLGGATAHQRKGTVAFDPSQAPGRHVVLAFFIGPGGLPRAVRTVARFTMPAAPTPPAPTIVRVLRRAHSAVVLLSRPPADPDPQAVAYAVSAAASTGQLLGMAFRTRDVRRIAGRPAIVLPGIPRAAKLVVKLRARYGGRASRIARATSARRKG